jgi:tight adherence protein B
MPVPVLVIGAIALVVIIVGVASSMRGEQAVVQDRLGRYAETDRDKGKEAKTKKSGDTEKTSPLTDGLNKALEGRGFADNLSAQLASADLKVTAAEFFALQVITVVGGFSLAYVVFGGGILLAFFAGVGGFFGPRIYVNMRRNGRLNKFNDQLGDAIMQMSNGLRAGYSVLQAMESVASELPAPICQEFRRVVQEMQLGVSMEQSLSNMLRRIDSEDLDLMITAVNVQREVGGNLADILDVISFTIRERVRIKGEVRTLTSQGRMSGYVIGFLPFGLALLLMMLNRAYIMQMFQSACGWMMVVLTVVLVGAGMFAMSKITNIEV